MPRPLIKVKKPQTRRAKPPAEAATSQLADAASPVASVAPREGHAWTIAAVALAIGFVAAYAQTIASLVAVWLREPDYSHGFLVAPVALLLLWTRRSELPALAASPAWGGLSLILVAAAMRLASGLLFVDTLDGWSILPWLAGAAWLWGGRPFMNWCSRGICFLVFLAPLPWRAETALSLPLQSVATKLSCWMLQCLGQHAIAEGTTILLGDVQLEVAEACSGLRMFVGIAALAVGYALFARKAIWQKLLLLATVVPVSLVANAARITVTGFVHQYLSSESAVEFNHEVGGWLMAPFAALLFAAALWYFNRLFLEVALVPNSKLLRS